MNFVQGYAQTNKIKITDYQSIGTGSDVLLNLFQIISQRIRS